MTQTSDTTRSPLPSAPPEAWEPLLRMTRLARRPLERFLGIEAASGVLLLLTAAVALVWANSPFAGSYRALWHTPVGLRLGGLVFERPLEWVVNDGLMVIFFFVVGLEIRREIHHGELSEWRRAALPVAAALGGMVAPALLYLALAGGSSTRAGWGVPMATDIAFAVGILTLLGKRVPPALRVLLLALAVIDDLGAILVIALFYSSALAWDGFAIAGGGLLAIAAMQRMGVRWKLAYVLPTMVAWAGIYRAGVHPTIAGVLVGLATPVRAWLGPDGFVAGVREELDQLSSSDASARDPHALARTLQRVDAARREAISPAESLIETLHPYVAFGIMPLFALANAGVSLDGLRLEGTGLAVASGITVGLVLGKPLGVWVAVAVARAVGLASLPLGLGARHLAVLGIVAGVGFTMSIFIAQLAFTDAAMLAAAKLAVLVASGVAAVLALVLGRFSLDEAVVAGAATTADEAESSTDA